MAKRKDTPAEMPVEEKLRNLYQLQTLLTEIDQIRSYRGELPHEVQDLEDDVEGLKTRLDRMTDEVSRFRSEINAHKNNIVLNTQKLNNYKEQLDTVRSNRDYDVLNREIEYVTSEVELSNKRVQEFQTLEAQKEESIRVSEEELQEKEDVLNTKKRELKDIIAETEADEERLREKARNLELNIEPRLLTAFKRIRKNSHNGLGIVYVQRDSCGGCFAKIPPQRQLDIRMRKKIIVCEYCGRILIDPELAGVKTENAAEEKKPKRRRATKKAAETKKETE